MVGEKRHNIYKRGNIFSGFVIVMQCSHCELHDIGVRVYLLKSRNSVHCRKRQKGTYQKVSIQHQ